MRFAVMGDFHYCAVPPSSMIGGGGVYDDRPRYRTITLREAPGFLDTLVSEKPEFVVCTGDVVEGGLQEPAAAKQEAVACLREFSRRNLQLINTAGTHESAEVMRDCIMPVNEKAGIERGPGYSFHFTRENLHILFVDYRAFGADALQRDWVSRTLASIPDNEWLAVAAHGPLFQIARPFFSEAAMVTFLKRELKNRKADFFFCGHTHNQTLSSHRMPAPMLQVKCSSIGFAADEPLELEQEQRILETSGYHWGAAETSAPGFWIFDIQGKRAQGVWHVPGHDITAAFIKEHGKPARMTVKPEFKKPRMAPFDRALVREACLNVYGLNIRGNEARVMLNGRDMGTLPPNTAWAARRRFILGEDDITRLSSRNTLEITAAGATDWVLGGFCLTGTTLDGRRWRSAVDPSIYICGKKYTSVWGMPNGGIQVKAEERRKAVLAIRGF